jgi:hypoxanthine phosphoribosyltransferase
VYAVSANTNLKKKLPEKSELLFAAKEIDLLVSKLADEVSATMSKSEHPAIFVCVLKGAWMFMADLVRKIPHATQVDFIRAASYGHGTASSGVVKVELPASLDVNGKDVYVLDEIIDTGRTLQELKKVLLSKGATSVKLVALLDKKSRREVDVDADFVGVEIPDVFVVGYGLDWGEKYRDLADIRSIIQ